jgi:hypothetical protein
MEIVGTTRRLFNYSSLGAELGYPPAETLPRLPVSVRPYLRVSGRAHPAWSPRQKKLPPPCSSE